MDLSACSERASLNSPLKLAASSFALLAWVTVHKNWPQLTFLVSQYVPFLIPSLTASTSLLSLRFFSLLSFLPDIFLISLFTSPLILLSAECAFQIGNNFDTMLTSPQAKMTRTMETSIMSSSKNLLTNPWPCWVGPTAAVTGLSAISKQVDVNLKHCWRLSLELINVTNNNESAWSGRQFHHCNYAIVSSTALLFRWSKVDFKSFKHLIAILGRCRIF